VCVFVLKRTCARNKSCGRSLLNQVKDILDNVKQSKNLIDREESVVLQQLNKKNVETKPNEKKQDRSCSAFCWMTWSDGAFPPHTICVKHLLLFLIMKTAVL
jgi:hypothetical protein